jgi:hypothetical protein
MKTILRRTLPLVFLFVFPAIIFASNIDNIKNDYVDVQIYDVENRTEYELEKMNLVATRQMNLLNIDKYQVIIAKDEALLILKSDEEKIELQTKIDQNRDNITELETENQVIENRLEQIEIIIRLENPNMKLPDEISLVGYIIYTFYIFVLYYISRKALKFVYDQMNNRIAGNWANRRKDFVISGFYIFMSFMFFGSLWYITRLMGIISGLTSIYNWTLYSVIAGSMLLLYSTSVERKI